MYVHVCLSHVPVTWCHVTILAACDACLAIAPQICDCPQLSIGGDNHTLVLWGFVAKRYKNALFGALRRFGCSEQIATR